MTGLSVGATAAWQLAVWEAAWLKNQYVEKEHLLCGILSLEKLLNAENQGFDAKTREVLKSQEGGGKSSGRVAQIVSQSLTVLLGCVRNGRQAQVRLRIGSPDPRKRDSLISATRPSLLTFGERSEDCCLSSTGFHELDSRRG
jgi:hypothetical protein